MAYFKVQYAKSQIDPDFLTRDQFFTIQRQSRCQLPTQHWLTSDQSLRNVKVLQEGRMEDVAEPSLLVDFANKHIGGGVLGFGWVQEKILFLIHPELLLSCLICVDPMAENEAILLVGAERTAEYSGYADKFQYVSIYNDTRELDNRGRLACHIIAIDALEAQNLAEKQFSQKYILRELNKAYVGFCQNQSDQTTSNLPVNTGKWGCGAFGGDKHLKTLIQWIAASECGRDMIFSLFNDSSLQNLGAIVDRFQMRSVGELMQYVLQAREDIRNSNLFDILMTM